MYTVERRARFKDFVQKSSGGCWFWIGAKSGKYGGFYISGKMYRAHRVSWELNNGYIPNGLFVLHKCDKPKCVNPAHLWVGTQKENVQDMVRKGRSPNRKGVNGSLAKLTEKEVKKIRKDKRTQRVIAKSYHVSQTSVWMIKTRRNWNHVP